MNTQVRRQRIEELLQTEGFCNVTSLAKRLGVSEVTIRTDLSALEEGGKITRIHGGAILSSEHMHGAYFEERSSINQDRKMWIARRAAELVENYDSLLLDASTTAFFMANFLKNHRGLTVFTNGIEVAFRLAENRSNKVVLTGGLLRPETASLAGPFGSGLIAGIRAKKAFFSCSGWSPLLELMDDDILEAQLKKEMLEVVESVILLVDSSKFEKQGVSAFAPMSRVNMVITDDGVSPERLAQLKHVGVQISICSKQSTRIVESASEGRPVRLGFANQDDEAPFSRLVRLGLLRAAASADIELLLADNHEDGPAALANADTFIREKVDLVAEFNTDARYNNMLMERFRSANIPVIAIDIPLPGATFVGVDNYRAGLMAGRLAGLYVNQLWEGQVDVVLSLGLPSSGLVPATRMQGQIDGLRETVSLLEEHILHLDSKNTYLEAQRTITTLLPRLAAAQHIVILGMNDQVVLGALSVLEEAKLAERAIAVSQGADQTAREELQRAGTRFIGAVTSFPEHYGEFIIETALQILQGKQVPPAVYTRHLVVLSLDAQRLLELDTFPAETISVQDYTSVPFPHLTTHFSQKFGRNHINLLNDDNPEHFLEDS